MIIIIDHLLDDYYARAMIVGLKIIKQGKKIIKQIKKFDLLNKGIFGQFFNPRWNPTMECHDTVTQRFKIIAPLRTDVYGIQCLVLPSEGSDKLTRVSERFGAFHVVDPLWSKGLLSG